MKSLTIDIPDGLTPAQEAVLITKKLLGKNALYAKNGKDNEIGHVHTQINVVRHHKTINIDECAVCKTLIERRIAKRLWVNYGGVEKLRRYCSIECRDVVIEICGADRVAKNRRKLKHYGKRLTTTFLEKK